MDNLNDNIIFFLQEKTSNENETNAIELQKMMCEFEEEFKGFIHDDSCENNNNDIMSFYGNIELYYNNEYNIKELLKICQYYGIDKDIRTSKCKKQDIVSTIVFFESLPENFDLVQRRNKLWAYMTELSNDPKMKKYILWK